MIKDVVLKSQQLLSKPVRRREGYYQKLSTYMQTKEIVVVTGHRRVGKSSIVRDFLQWTSCFYLNKELDVTNVIDSVEVLISVFDERVQEYGEPAYIVIDEVQDIRDRERAVRAWRAQETYHIIITWSNSTLLSGELGTYLTGRYMEMVVSPLSFSEFCEFQDRVPSHELFDQYMVVWWLPELLLLPQESHLHQMYIKQVRESILYKDVLPRTEIRDISLMEKIAAFLADSTWYEVSLSKIANTLTSNGYKTTQVTVSRYMQALADAMIIQRVSRYDIKWKKRLKYLEKIYYTDHSMRNLWWYSQARDRGQLLEMIVYNELIRRGYEVVVGKRYEYEIDFIATKWTERLAIQVAYVIHEQNIQRELWNLVRIPQGCVKCVISMSPWWSHTVDEDGLHLWHAYEWLLS